MQEEFRQENKVNQAHYSVSLRWNRWFIIMRLTNIFTQGFKYELIPIYIGNIVSGFEVLEPILTS